MTTSLPATMLILVCAALTIASPQSANGQKPRTAPHYRITGTAVNARDNSPIPLCHITAMPSLTGRGGGRAFGQFGGRTLLETDADTQGRFAIDVPSEGNWTLTGRARGFHTQTLDVHEGFFSGVVLTAAHPSEDVVFHLASDAVIAGVITDDAGEVARGALVRLFVVEPAALETGGRPLQARNTTQTDDRGHYEFDGVTEGTYKLNVQARPWYATPNPPAQTVDGIPTPSPDPSLDVVFPVTWYPGVTDDSSAEALTIHPGDTRQADLTLRAEAAAHLLVPYSPPPAAATRTPGGQILMMRGNDRPTITLLSSDGLNEGGMLQATQQGSGNQLDFGGLTPGTYQVTEPGPGPGTPGRVSIVHISSAGSVTDLSAATSEVTVTIQVEGDSSIDPSEVSLTDMATGRVVGRGGMNGFDPGGPMQFNGGGRGGPGFAQGRPGGQPDGLDGRGGRGGRRRSGEPREATLDVPPGRYEVGLANVNAYLTGVTAIGAQVAGRIVTIPGSSEDGPPHLTVHLAAGLATVDGKVMFAGRPDPGAMVLLVPATLGSPSSLTIVRRDQTNTDGSFALADVIPGQYILLAIDHGWGVNWRDTATLATYLLHGSPIELTASSRAHPVIEAVAP
jgi:hypothetical protein